MFKKYRHAKEEAEELNLIPVMNLMVVLIPFLMLGAAFYHLGTIPTSIPDNVPAADAKPPSDVKVTINLIIEPTEMILSGSGAGLDEAEAAGMKITLKQQGKSPNVKGLRKHLMAIKGKYPKSDTAIILPADTIPYEKLVVVLDAVREMPAGKDAKGDPKVAPLFPVSVFSRRLKAPPEGEDIEGEEEAAE